MIETVNPNGLGFDPFPEAGPNSLEGRIINELARRMPGWYVGIDIDGMWFALRARDGFRFFAITPGRLWELYQLVIAGVPAQTPAAEPAPAKAATPAETDRSGRVVLWLVGAFFLAALLVAALAGCA